MYTVRSVDIIIVYLVLRHCQAFTVCGKENFSYCIKTCYKMLTNYYDNGLQPVLL